MFIGNVIFLLLVLISFAGLYKIFEKTGRATWKAFIPFLNFYEWIKLLERPWWWVFLMIVPGVNILMYSVLTVITAQYFGKRKTMDLTLAAFFSFLYLVFLGFSKEEKWTGIEDIKNKKGGFMRTWLDPLIFAVIAATVIRTFFLEAFTIPTSSLEKSLMVGDFLFVNKFAYGAKIPQTPIAFPFAHHTLPFTKETKSYLEWMKLPYFRLPGYSDIKNYDIVVFNYPDGDTVLLKAQDRSYYNFMRQYAAEGIDTSFKHKPFTADILSQARTILINNEQQFGRLAARPSDKREHYVKRCVAIAGDKFEVRDGEIYINEKQLPTPENAQHNYIVKLANNYIDVKMLDKLDIYVDEAYMLNKDFAESNGVLQFSLSWSSMNNTPGKESYGRPYEEGNDSLVFNSIKTGDTSIYMLNLTKAKIEQIRALPGFESCVRKNEAKGKYDYSIFPHHPRYPWNNDNFGPFVMPKTGMTIPIDTSNICLYDRIIDVYDNNDLEVRNGKIFINGAETKTYTFKQDYYFMMGDNRHNSADSRSWGVVPFDHVVGKPVFVWLSMKDPEKNPISGKSWMSSLTKNSKDGKFRWERFFCFVSDKGLSRSYFIHFLVIVFVWWGTAKYLRKRREKKEVTNKEIK
ncbi:MAG: family signal peptidase [Bacteroidetes bacterium]|jgi:signal peptidase I|nr:family signal peptidase [Bacteroidota bacterium]